MMHNATWSKKDCINRLGESAMPNEKCFNDNSSFDCQAKAAGRAFFVVIIVMSICTAGSGILIKFTLSPTAMPLSSIEITMQYVAILLFGLVPTVLLLFVCKAGQGVARIIVLISSAWGLCVLIAFSVLIVHFRKDSSAAITVQDILCIIFFVSHVAAIINVLILGSLQKSKRHQTVTDDCVVCETKESKPQYR